MSTIAVIFDSTPDADKSSDRDLDKDSTSQSERDLHNFACFFAEDSECWGMFVKYVKSFGKTGI